MTKEEFYKIASPEKMLSIANQLNEDERDVLKYKVSRLCVEQLKNDFEIDNDPVEIDRFNQALECLSIIQQYKDRVPEYGLVYKGRPSFMTDDLLSKLQSEAIGFRKHASINIDQYIRCADTPRKDSVAETLEEMDELHHFVEEVAGKCKPSYISNYIYYDNVGHCSKPHVDNAFTAITVMIGLKHDWEEKPKSVSVAYWSKRPRLEYMLAPGEVAVFYGASALHGRTPVSYGETVHSLLLSYRPE